MPTMCLYFNDEVYMYIRSKERPSRYISGLILKDKSVAEPQPIGDSPKIAEGDSNSPII